MTSEKEAAQKALNYRENAVTAQASGKEKEALYLNNVGRAYFTLAAEQSKPEFNNGTVRRLEYAISCFQHAASAEAENKSEKAIYWEKLGDDSMR